jgi:hypothetical protein
MDCGCTHIPNVLGDTRLCHRGWIKLPLKVHACAASLGQQPDFVEKVAHRLDGQPRSHGELEGVRRAPAMLPREGRLELVTFCPAD